MTSVILSPAEFKLFQELIYQEAGISMSDAKQALVSGRLNRRVRHYGFDSYRAYFDYISEQEGDDEQRTERQLAIDLLTTNETYFFREPKHFEYLESVLIPLWNQHGKPRRIWSAASSSGEEAYTLAMVCKAHAKVPIEIIGSDISRRVLDTASRARYPLAKAERIPEQYLKQSCLRGVGKMSGVMQIDQVTRAMVKFIPGNLQQRQKELGNFDLILLRNVMIYFNQDTKHHVVSNVTEHLVEGGTLMVGHSESLHGIADGLRVAQTSIYEFVGPHR